LCCRSLEPSRIDVISQAIERWTGSAANRWRELRFGRQNFPTVCAALLSFQVIGAFAKIQPNYGIRNPNMLVFVGRDLEVGHIG
jgi:hypothetical protein